MNSFVQRAALFAYVCLIGCASNAFGATISEFDESMPSLVEYDDQCAQILKAHSEAHFEEAFRLAEGRARAGNPVAAGWLGYFYFSGKGVEKNLDEGLRNLRIGDAAGVATASYWLAVAFAKGEGVERSSERAREFQNRGNRAQSSYGFYMSKKYAPGLLGHKIGDALPYRFWTQYGQYYSRLLSEVSSVTSASLDEKPSSPIGRLPGECRPSTPPAKAMSMLKVYSLDGYISIFVGANNRAEVVHVHGLSDGRLAMPVFEVFDNAFQRPQCVIPIPIGQRILIPFKFALD